MTRNFVNFLASFPCCIAASFQAGKYKVRKSDINRATSVPRGVGRGDLSVNKPLNAIEDLITMILD